MTRARATAGVLAIGLALGLAGCGKDDDKSPAASSSRSASPSAAAKFVTDGSSPDDFPSSVPLPSGKVTASRDGVQTGGRAGWTVVKQVQQPVRAAFRSADSALEAKGYEGKGKATRVRTQVAQRTYVGDEYQVSLTVSQLSAKSSLVSTQVVSAEG